MATLRSYAKVNLALRVYRLRRGERLHRIDSVFALYKPLYDTVRIEPANVDLVVFRGAKISGENTITAALQQFRAVYKTTEHYRVTVDKRIPIGSGLGGGSSNAGAVLRFLAQRHKVPLKKIIKIAAKVGSDVPFFVSGYEQARVGGFGQKVEKIEAPWHVSSVILSAVPSLTRDVYLRFDSLETPQHHKTIASFLNGTCLPFNDLQRAFLETSAADKQRLSQLRLDGHVAIVSGSGSAIAVLAHQGKRIE